MRIPYTTLSRLKEAGACKGRFNFLQAQLGTTIAHDTPIPLVKILEINGLKDALWVPENILSGEFIQRRYRLFTVACCQEILHMMTDQRSKTAVIAAHLYAYGEVSEAELAAARAAAWAAARAAARDAAAWDAAWDAAWARQTEIFKVIFSAEYED